MNIMCPNNSVISICEGLKIQFGVITSEMLGLNNTNTLTTAVVECVKKIIYQLQSRVMDNSK